MATFVNSGIAGQIVYAAETTYGTAASLTSAGPLEFTSETLELQKTTVQGAGLHAGGLYFRGPRRVLTNYSVSGGITMDLPTEYMHGLLTQMIGATVSSTTSTGTYTTNVYAPGPAQGKSLTIQKAAAPTLGTATALSTSVVPYTYVGCKITEWTMSVATGALATLALTVDGRNELGQGYSSSAPNYDGINSAAPALATFSEDNTNNVFHFRQANLITGTTVSTTGGVSAISSPTTLATVKSASFTHQLQMDTSRYFLGSAGFKAEPIENNFRNISGSMTAEFNLNVIGSNTLYQMFAGDIPLAMELTFQAIGGTVGASPSLSILIPQVFLNGESPKINGPAVIDLTIPFTGLDDGANNPIQFTYTSLTADAA